MRIKPYFLAFVMSITATTPVLGVGKQQTKTQGVRQSNDKVLINKAQAAVIYILKDPQSAQFRNVHVGTEDFKPVRGEVNSKNSYGGYIGFKKFYFDQREAPSGKVYMDDPIPDISKYVFPGDIMADDSPKDGDSDYIKARKNTSRAARDFVNACEKLKTDHKLMFEDGW